MPLPDMNAAVGFILAALVLSPAAFAAPAGVDAGKKAGEFSSEHAAVLPGKKNTELNVVVGEKRFATESIERKSAVVGDRRSTIAVRETREKKLFATPDRKEYEVVERKDSRWAGKSSRFSTSEDRFECKVAVRFQDRIGDASPFNDNVKPIVSKRTSFDKINRFAFRRNAEQGVSVSKAGSGQDPVDISGASSPSGTPAAAPAEKNSPGPATPSAR
jgi:hypothetical protein